MFGFERLDSICIDGFNIVSPRYVEGDTMRITLVPSNEKEFTYYIQKYIESFGLSRSTAMIELERIVTNEGNPDALRELYKYKNKF